MSRIGKKTIQLPDTVKLSQQGQTLLVQGPKGELRFDLPVGIEMHQADKTISIKRKSDHKAIRALHGTCRSLLANMIKGVTEGFKKELEIEGVGYRAQMKGKILSMQLGFTHPIDYPVPDGITIQTPAQTQIVVTGADKRKVGQTASEIRSYRKPEPYKGKGIHYVGETIRRKAGKTVA